ncbi:Transposase, IS1380 family [Crocosphaera watsonii WH 0003]|uniref:Transposase, IS1380 family n=1 Tax=Crocosphaera watsonii WH 0003 TaxID=423471 RepID=G5J4U7_CROWT|nr:Transposase, IS1380 family [Crocosphaera watsonii WH 0003]
MLADRTSTQTFQSNQLRLWIHSWAYVLINAFRQTLFKKNFIG